MKTSFVSLSIALQSLVFTANAFSATQQEANTVGLNLYCDPINTMYLGGTPLYNEATGESQDRADYLASKGLNEFCDPIGTVYLGGSPLFDEITGITLTLEEYLARK